MQSPAVKRKGSDAETRACCEKEDDMSTTNNSESTVTTNEATSPHKAERPMKVIIDGNGCNWLCDAEVDESSDLSQQGCWRCSEMAFTRS